MPVDPIWWLALALQLVALPGTLLPVLPGLLWLPGPAWGLPGLPWVCLGLAGDCMGLPGPVWACAAWAACNARDHLNLPGLAMPAYSSS